MRLWKDILEKHGSILDVHGLFTVIQPNSLLGGLLRPSLASSKAACISRQMDLIKGEQSQSSTRRGKVVNLAEGRRRKGYNGEAVNSAVLIINRWDRSDRHLPRSGC